jgi:hypothetical protein
VSDATTEQAIRTVAAQAAAFAVRHQIDWDEYPDIGEHDWARVLTELDRSTPYPPTEDYAAAYAHLMARANHHHHEDND